MNYINWAHAVSMQSNGAILMSEFSLPDYQRNMEEMVDMFEEDDRFGLWLININDGGALNTSRPLAAILGHHDDVLKAAFCLQPVAALYHKYRQRTPGYVQLFRLPTNQEPLNTTLNEFMSFPEFVATRTENVSDCNSNWTGEPTDDDDHVKGYFYGKDHYRFLITENDHTDMVGLVYRDWGYAEENLTELEALAYRCYLHDIGVLSDDELRVFFPAPFKTRRTSLTY